MAGINHQGLTVGHLLEIQLDQIVLHPVLKNLAAFAIGHQFIGIEGHFKIQVVVDHHLERPSLKDFSGIGINGFGLQRALGPVTIAVNPAAVEQFV